MRPANSSAPLRANATREAARFGRPLCRILESTGVEAEPIYYRAGYTVDNDEEDYGERIAESLGGGVGLFKGLAREFTK